MKKDLRDFQKQIIAGIPEKLPAQRKYDKSINHAPKRVNILTKEEKKLALQNALRYFSKKFHKILISEFAKELKDYGRIYMYRFRPNYQITARTIEDFPHKSKQAAAIMLMISNNLDETVAQHPHELITYGGNGSVFQNWAQYLLTMKYLSTMTDDQTLILYSGHPLGLFPSNKDAPRVVVTNGMMVPNYSKPEDLERFNTLGVTQYGQMTAGSFMYIGPQGIVHGTTITILNAGRKKGFHSLKGKLFVSSGLGGMSGAQAKAASIAGAIGIIAEVNPKAVEKRYKQGWVNEVYKDLNSLLNRADQARVKKESVSLAYLGNIVDLWEKLASSSLDVELGSDQTSLHNPYGGGYYPAGLSFEGANEMLSKNPSEFQKRVQVSLQRQVLAINKMAQKGMYFWDYGNAFLLEARKAGADIIKKNGEFKYPSYVQDIMGPMCFDYGFGPFRWVCSSSLSSDLDETDKIALRVLKEMLKKSPSKIKRQLEDNINWIQKAKENNLVIGSKARILYAERVGRIKIALEFNKAISRGIIKAPIVLGRDHHDVSGADSPYRETSNIYDGSKFTADMAVQNVIGDAVRGATWVSIHNGGGVGWGEVINSGFGLVIDGSKQSEKRIKLMLSFDVLNGLARRSWARSEEAIFSIQEALKTEPKLKVTLPNLVDNKLLKNLF